MSQMEKHYMMSPAYGIYKKGSKGVAISYNNKTIKFSNKTGLPNGSRGLGEREKKFVDQIDVEKVEKGH